MENVAIIVLNWNNAKDTLECLSSLRTIIYPHYEVIVVDNDSSDDSVEQIRAQFPEVTILENGENRGFAGGNNRGIDYALKRGADFILLLNNDTVVDPDILNAFLMAAKQHPKAGVFGALIYSYHEPSAIWYGGGKVHPTQIRCFHEGSTEAHETQYACGCALFIRSAIVRQVGVMDDRFFLLWEEIDWCWRIRAAGYSCLTVPEAKVWHKVSASFDGGNHGPLWQYYYWRNRLLFLQRNYSKSLKTRFYLKFFSMELPLLTLLAFNPLTTASERKPYRSALRGVRDYFLKKFGPRKA